MSTPEPQHFAISLDDFAHEVHGHLERHQDGGAGHFARCTAPTKAEAVDRAVAVLRELVEEVMYESTDYGYPRGDE